MALTLVLGMLVVRLMAKVEELRDQLSDTISIQNDIREEMVGYDYTRRKHAIQINGLSQMANLSYRLKE